MSAAWEATEFQRLCERRDLMALNCVNAINFVLLMFEAQNFERSREHLQHALDQHKEADLAITEFLNSKKENQHHGHSAA